MSFGYAFYLPQNATPTSFSSPDCIGVPVAMTSLAFIAGVLLTPLGFETKGRPLPP